MQQNKRNLVEHLVLLVLLGALFLWVAIEARSFPPKSGVFPGSIATVAVILVLIEFVLTLTRRPKREYDEDDDMAHLDLTGAVVRVLPYLAWIGGFYLLIYLLSLPVASAIFVAAFLTVVGKVPWYLSLAGAGALLLGLLGLAELLNLYWPDAMLMQWLEPVFDRGG